MTTKRIIDSWISTIRRAIELGEADAARYRLTIGFVRRCRGIGRMAMKTETRFAWLGLRKRPSRVSRSIGTGDTPESFTADPNRAMQFATEADARRERPPEHYAQWGWKLRRAWIHVQRRRRIEADDRHTEPDRPVPGRSF